MDLFEFAAQKETEPEDMDPDSKEKGKEFQEGIYTVSEITGAVKSLITAQFGRQNIWVKGEVSNCKKQQSGHIYFRLKDQSAVLNAAFFRGANRNLDFELKDGMEVLALGRMDVWERGGNYQLIVTELRPGGAGELYLRFEQLKKKLEEEGLFDPARKKKLPEFPTRIGLITSPTGAAIRDMIHVTQTRCPYVKMFLFPVKVQGEGSAGEITKAIEEANQVEHALDLIIVGRGGGSIEDLWAFNEEIVARAISQSRLPIISAVGHQTDFTISDFVADQRAATPSQAAEMSVPNYSEVRQRVDLLMKNIVRDLQGVREVAAARLREIRRASVLRDPRVLLEARQQRLDEAISTMMEGLQARKDRETDRVERVGERIRLLLRQWIEPRKLRCENIVKSLSLLNPLAILARGYSVVRKKNLKVIKESGQVQKGEDITVQLHQGALECKVTNLSKISPA